MARNTLYFVDSTDGCGHGITHGRFPWVIVGGLCGEAYRAAIGRDFDDCNAERTVSSLLFDELWGRLPCPKITERR